MNVDQHIPAARQNDLVTTESGDEVLVYDLASNQIHHLNSASAVVWSLCDGQRTVTEVAVGTGMTEDLVTLAVSRLDAADLLSGRVNHSLRDISSRRSFLRRSAMLGAASVPAIVSVTAPTAALAGSCQGVDFGPGEVCGTYGPGSPQTNLGRNCCKNPNTGYQPTCQFRQYTNCQDGYYDAQHCDAQLACQ